MILTFKAKYSRSYSSEEYPPNDYKSFPNGIRKIRLVVPYYNIIFKDDLIQYKENIYSVYECTLTTGRMPCDKNGKELYPEGGHQKLEYKIIIGNGYDHVIGYYNCFMYKRPWFNWIKFFIVLITKTYIK